MPKVIPFHKVHDLTVIHLDKNNFFVGAIRIRESRYSQIRTATHPFRVVKSISVRSSHRLNQFSGAISDKNSLVSPVAFAHEFLPHFSSEIKEQRLFCRILRKRYVASLFTTIPNRIASITRHCRSLFCNPCAKQAGSRYSESLIR